LIVLVILGGVGYGLFRAINLPQKPNLRTAKIDRGTLTFTVNATGNVAARQTANLSFDAPGVVTAINVTEGQRVDRGQVLIQQDNTAQQLAITQADANYQAAQLSLDQLLAPPSASDLALAEGNLKAAQTTYNALLASVDPNAVKAAELKVQQAETAYQDAITHRKDTGGRVPTDSPTYQLALAQEGQASFALAIAQLQLQILKRGTDSRILVAAKAQIDQARAQLNQLKAGPSQAQITRAQLGIDQAKNALDEAQHQLDATTLRAPFAGIVGTLTAQIGGLSVSTIPAVTLVDTSTLHVTLKVDELDIGRVKPDQPVKLTLDALPDTTVTGRVDQIALIADSTGAIISYDVTVQIDPTPAPLKVGMTASGTITVQELRDVLRIPNSYVRVDRRNNQAYANLVNADETLIEVPVQLGLRTDDYSQIVAGLNEGDTVGISLDSNFSLLGN
jgi:HlyD family secretion protein